ncbi:MAG TPA: DUF885 family protein, partial [Chitinophagaceae bacterium]|nr:DUF885 family protein [Chitinophagaceae bacterium]
MSQKIKAAVSSFCFLFLFTSIVQSQSSAISSLYTQTSEMANLMIQYDADRGSVMRFYSTTPVSSTNWWRQSEDEVNSPERRQRLLELIAAYVDQLKYVEFTSMNINGKVDYLLFKRNLEDERYQLLKEKKLFEEVAHYLPFAEKIAAIEKPRRRGIAPNAELVAKELDDINKEIGKAVETAKKMDSIDIDQAMMVSNTTKGLQGMLKNYFNFYNGYDPLFTWWVPKTYADTDSLLNLYAEAIKKKGRITTSQKDDGSGIVGKPIGREELIRQLKLEYIPYTPEELVEIANKEFAWCDAELLKASRDMGFGDDWKKAQETVKKSFVPPGKQPEAMYDLYKQSVDFLKANDLLTILPLAEESWRMYMMSPERQRVNPFFLGGETLIISYPTNTMSYDDKMMSMRGNNPNFSRATVHHELIAGHHLQGYMSNRYKTYRHFDTPFWVEGNALYWELLLWDRKFPQTPEQRIGMLFWRMHRCARIIFSLNYHLGKWRPQQCIDFLVDRVGHERANAEGEVRRSFTGGYGPLYQVAYMLGGLQFMALK